jgi:glycosyltransferase involved in cell wall biosynthesis
MPTYFGPTNLPPLEAFSLGVPVLYSDLIGLKDQVGEAALLLDLDDPGSLAQNIKNLISESSLKNLLIGNGYKLFNDNINFDRTVVLHNIIRRFKSRRDTWEK